MTGFYKDYADSSDTHQNSAEASADSAEQSATEAAASAAAALVSENNASTSESNASTSASNASTSESNASDSEVAALASQSSASASATSASADADDAEDSATEAAASALAASNSATTAQNLEVTSASFDTADGTLTLTKANSGTVTTDLDGRYAELTGDTFTGDVSFGDNLKAKFGADDDLLIYHSTTSGHKSVIEDTGRGGLDLITNGNAIRLMTDTGETMLSAIKNSGVSLVHDNYMKLQTTVDGIRVWDDAQFDTNINVDGNSAVSGDATVSGELTVTGNAEAELFKGDLEGAVHFKGATNGDALTKGDVVYVSGYSGTKTQVGLADASDSSKMPAFGIVAADPVGVNVDVVTFGTLKSINTSTYTDGDELYVSTTAGQLTATAPSGEGNLVQKIAKVVRAHNSGNIKVMGAGRTNATPNLNNGNIFIGDSNNQAVTTSLATQVSTLETSHDDVLVDGDFTSNGFMKRTGAGTYAVDSNTYLTSEANNLTTAVTWANVPDANITQTSVTQHQAALSITESQISDFGTYLTTHQDISGKANLSGAGFTGDVSTSTHFTASDYLANIGALGTAPIAHVTASTVSSPANNSLLEIGGTSYWANKFGQIALNAGAGGVEMHWHQNTDDINGQTLRFHTTDRGIHVGDDRTGTYTAGDNQSNADLDFGMLVGRESSNLGSNNFGFGYDVDFSVGTASNMGVGSLIDVLGTTSNSVAFGGDVKLGRASTPSDIGVTGSLVGGNIARTEGDYSFTWAKGEVDSNGVYPALNRGYGCTMFGHITEIDTNSDWCLAGGSLTFGETKTKIQTSQSSVAWGLGARCIDSDGSAVFGYSNLVHSGDECLLSGRSNTVYLDRCVVGGKSNTVGKSGTSSTTGLNSACFGQDNLVEGDNNFISGENNNSLGDSGACIGQGLKTPLFQQSDNTYSWDDYSITVGAFNAESAKYYTNTNNTAWVEDHRFVVGTGTSVNAKDNGFIVAVPDSGFCGIIMPALASSTDYASASAAKAGGVPVGGLYRIGSDVKILLSTD
jgi:cytoskeletal protein CcmA (bactofilin family)